MSTILRAVPNGESDVEDGANLRDEISRSFRSRWGFSSSSAMMRWSKTGMLRLDRDRLYGSLGRLEARVQEVEERDRPARIPATGL